MNSALSGIPIPRRRHLAATLALFSALFVAVGAVAATGSTPTTVRVFSALALVIAALLGLLAWGVLHSVKVDLAENRLDAAIDDAIAASGDHPDLACGCGHDHDADELHVTDACAHKSEGGDCALDCGTCVLAAMRPSPTTPRSERLAH